MTQEVPKEEQYNYDSTVFIPLSSLKKFIEENEKGTEDVMIIETLKLLKDKFIHE